MKLWKWFLFGVFAARGMKVIILNKFGQQVTPGVFNADNRETVQDVFFHFKRNLKSHD